MTKWNNDVYQVMYKKDDVKIIITQIMPDDYADFLEHVSFSWTHFNVFIYLFHLGES